MGRFRGIVGVVAGLAPDDGDATVSWSTARHIGRKAEVEELDVERTVAQFVGGQCRAYDDGFERDDPVEGELGLENDGVGPFSRALAVGSGGVVDPRLIVCGNRWRLSKGVQEEDISAVQTCYGNGVNCADRAVHSLLTVGGHIRVC